MFSWNWEERAWKATWLRWVELPCRENRRSEGSQVSRKELAKPKGGDVATLALWLPATAGGELWQPRVAKDSFRKGLLPHWQVHIWGSSLEQRPLCLTRLDPARPQNDAPHLRAMECFAMIPILFGGFVPRYASGVLDVLVIGNKLRLAEHYRFLECFWAQPV